VQHDLTGTEIDCPFLEITSSRGKVSTSIKSSLGGEGEPLSRRSRNGSIVSFQTTGSKQAGQTLEEKEDDIEHQEAEVPERK
jgi:hypothetical protein